METPAAAPLPALLLAAAAEGGPAGVFPPDAGARSAGVDELFWLATNLGAVAFAAVVAILVFAAVAWRARPGHRAAYATGEGSRARWATGIFALGVFVGFDVVLAVKDHRVWEAIYGDAARLEAEGALRVQVLARQFEWFFRYPGKDGVFGTADDLCTRTLVIPDDRPALLRLRSLDVIHSFFLPHWRTKQDAVPGMTTMLPVHPRRGGTGTFEIVCAELCGMGHYLMRGTMEVRDREGFEAWIREQEKEVAVYGPADGEFWGRYLEKGGAAPAAAPARTPEDPR
jgi:cytochrome c oxidase subunit 2